MGFNIKIKELMQEEYPFLLKQIRRLPEKMSMAGVLPPNDCKYLCVIGARKNSNYGNETCRKLISGLAGYPIVIVSGLAIGIDSIAHDVAIKTGLKTIAFPGSGLSAEALYPSSRRTLAMEIINSGGTLISPFRDDQLGANWTFPTRNRLMAGASHATLIIEAKKKSGTLITADYATEFGRDVLAVPGSIFCDLSYGPHMLIRRGATPVTSSEDILEALGFKVARGDEAQNPLPNFAEMSLSPEEKNIIDYLRLEPLPPSELVEKLSVSPAKLSTVISGLELRGIVSEQDGIFKLS